MGSAQVATDSPARVLAGLRAHRAAAEAHEAAILETAATWADLHPPESIRDAAYVDGTESEIAIAGAGAPLVAEFACAELAAALGVPTEWGTRLVGDALELRHRLPRLWERTTGGDLQVWRARRIAQSTRQLSQAAARWVDVQVAPFAHRVGPAQTERLVAAAVARVDPDLAEQQREAAAEGRFFEVDHRQVSFTGTSRIYGELDLADALDLDAAISAGAEALLQLGSTEGLDVRRAQAAGELARRQPALELLTVDPDQLPPTRRGGERRAVVLYVHISESAVSGADGVARVENAGGVRLVTVGQVREWCGNPDTRILIRPLLDLADHESVDSYEVPIQMAERVRLRHPTCVFPWCSRPSRRCELDHRTTFEECHETADDNLTPLCRHHHRLKTHGGWVYTRLDDTSMLWRSPHGLALLRDHTGTRDVTGIRSVDPPDD
jgi:hypothetical protein